MTSLEELLEDVDLDEKIQTVTEKREARFAAGRRKIDTMSREEFNRLTPPSTPMSQRGWTDAEINAYWARFTRERE